MRTLAVLVLLLSYGAVGARQPAVRSSVPLPVGAAEIARTLGLPSADHSRLLLDVVRLLYDAPDGQDAQDARLRNALVDLLSATDVRTSELVPLPLDLSVWRETILRRPMQDADILRTVMTDRQTALLYYGLAALDDETLAWLGPDRDTLQHLQRNAGAFAAFGRSLRIRANRVLVPGGPDQDAVWKSIVGADPTQPAAFVKKLFGGDRSRAAYFYDAVAHLDPARQRFALALALPESRRLERVRALYETFERGQADWLPADRPFMRLPLDPALILGQLRVTPDGRLQGPSRAVWEQVFRADEGVSVPFAAPGSGASLNADRVPADAAWIVSRIARIPGPVAQRRLHTVLFAQRVFQDAAESPALASALRGYMAYPALMMTLERMGISTPELYVHAAAQAQSLDSIREDVTRSAAIRQFQAVLGILARATQSGAIDPSQAAVETASLVALPVTAERGYGGQLGEWLRDRLFKDLPTALDEAPDPLDDALLAAMAGVRSDMPPAPIIEWEGGRYRVDPARAELKRLRRVRERQGPPTVDDALGGPAPADGPLADALTSVLYAASLGDPEGTPLEGGNVATRHVLGSAAWRIPVEEFGTSSGWRLAGSLLGLDVTLRRLALRRLDSGVMPPEPRMSSNERQTAYLAVSLMNPAKLTDAARDEIAAAIARGRARVESVSDDPQAIERVAADAGLSEWRREAAAWTATHDPARLLAEFSLVELLWIGGPKPSLLPALDAWGASPMVLSGCVCLEMPLARPWEELAGRPAVGVLATRAADVSLVVAETLAARQLPAALAPGVVAFAMQDVIDQAQPGYLEDWSEFSRAARELRREVLEDYIAALAAGGPLLPVETDDRRP